MNSRYVTHTLAPVGALRAQILTCMGRHTWLYKRCAFYLDRHVRDLQACEDAREVGWNARRERREHARARVHPACHFNATSDSIEIL